MSEILHRDGVYVFPVFDTNDMGYIDASIENVLRSFKEIKLSKRKQFANKPAMAAFGAMGVPSGWHHPNIRYIRRMVAKVVRQEFADAPFKNVQLLMDRLAIRVPGTSISGESWHRDQTPEHLMEPGDVLLGGWVNLNSDLNQQFECVKGTHLVRSKGSGFVTAFTKEEKQHFTKHMDKVVVPPGHCILFFQHIVHRVRQYKITRREKRLFIGVRFTNSDKSIFDYSDAIEKQGVPPLPSGALPKIYEKMHAINWQPRLQEWLTAFVPEMHHGNPKLKTPISPVAKSLAELGPKFMYPPYDLVDVMVLKPMKL